jgi:hypothetical protein
MALEECLGLPGEVLEAGEDPTVLGGDGVVASGEARAPVLGARIIKLEYVPVFV